MVKTRKNNNFQPYIGLIPGLILFAIFVIIPILYNFYYSITDYNGFPGSQLHIVGLQNFADAFTSYSSNTLNAIKNSFIYAIFITIIQNGIAVIVAIILSIKSKFNNFFKAVYFFPNVLGAFAIAQIWALLLNPYFGPLAKIFEIFGINIDFLGDPNIAKYTIIFIQVWISMGYAMIIYYTNIMSIPTELHEAAEIDGTNFLQKIKYIILPLIIPSLTINILLSLIGSLKLFDIVFLLTKGGPGISSQNLPVYIFNEAFQFSRHGYGAALNVIQFVIIFSVSMIVFKILKSKELDY